AHDVHVPAQHVPQLRNLVQPRAAEEAPYRRDSWVVLRCPLRTRPLGIHHHRAKLVDGKYPPAIVGSATIALPAVRVRSSRLGVSRACTASASVTRAPVLPHPRLTVEYRTRAAQLDGECHHEHYGEQHHQSNTGQGNVQG